MLYCNAVGSQTEIVFDGGSLVYDKSGNKVHEMKYFEEDYQVFELESLSPHPNLPPKGKGTANTQGQLVEETIVHAKFSKEQKYSIGGASAQKENFQKSESQVSPLGGDLEGAVFFSATDVGVGEDIIKYLTNEKNMY